MTSKLKCPFCQQELKCWDEPQDTIYSNWSCPNCRRFAYGNKLIWQELIRTRKALDVAVDALKRIEEPVAWGSLYQEQEIATEALEQITAILENKRNKISTRV